MNTLKSNESSYFPALTGVRAIAAYLVFMHHYAALTLIKPNSTIYNFIEELHVGVTFFFTLSGFLIAYRYFDTTDFNFKKYIVNRIARIYPMYFLLTTLTFIVFYYTKERNTINDLFIYLSNITFIRGYFNNLKFSGIGQGWSLTVEETFYFLAPVFFFLLRRNLFNIIILPISLILFGIIQVYIFQRFNFLGFMNSLEFMFNYTFWGRCFEFFIGIGLALIFKSKKTLFNFPYLTQVGLIVITICIFSISLFKGENDFGIRHPVGKVLNTFIMPLFGIAIFYYGLLTEKTFISKILSTKLFVLLGKSSYIFYLIHIGVIVYYLEFYSKNLLFLFISINIISIVLYTLIEEPSNKLIRNYFNNRKTK